MGFSARLLKKIPPVSFELAEVRDVQEVYTFLWHCMRASQDLCVEAWVKSGDTSLGDYFDQHRQEEEEHAEWLRQDLDRSGALPPDLPDALAAALVGSMYYLIHHVSPICLLGYMLYLEGHSMPIGTLVQLEERFGRSLFRTARIHAEEDPEHALELCAVIDALPERDQLHVEYAMTLTQFYWKAAAVRQDVGVASIIFKQPEASYVR